MNGCKRGGVRLIFPPCAAARAGEGPDQGPHLLHGQDQRQRTRRGPETTPPSWAGCFVLLRNGLEETRRNNRTKSSGWR